MAIYDAIGQSYASTRRPDPRIVDSLLNLLSLPKASVIADIGAGTGGYSQALADRGYCLRGVEPSQVMQGQAKSNPRIQWFSGYAEQIPLPTVSVDAVISILATHHFSNLKQAIQQMYRVTGAGPIVLLTFDPRLGEKFWFADYFPQLWQDTFRVFPSLDDVIALIQQTSRRTVEVSPLMLPYDLEDMFAAAGWRQPQVYLDPNIRAGMSCFRLADADVVKRGVSQLKQDLSSGRWQTKYGEIQALEWFDPGYRLLSAKVSD